MTLAFSDDWLRVYGGDNREVMRTLPEESVHCVVTSPPYWNLRDYGTGTWMGGRDDCDHTQPRSLSTSTLDTSTHEGTKLASAGMGVPYRGKCGKCGAIRMEPTVWGGDDNHDHEWNEQRYYVEGGGGAGSSSESFTKPGPDNAQRLKEARWRKDSTCSCGAWSGQLGLEPTPQGYVQNLVAVFREIWRVLRDDGTVWLNLGDTYAAGTMNGARGPNGLVPADRGQGTILPPRKPPVGLKHKDLVGIPWRVAFALQADGWYLRSDIIWAKPNTMPESIRDRPTKSHEYLFLLTKSPRYFYDPEAVREEGSGRNWAQAGGNIMGMGIHKHVDGYVDRGEGRDVEEAYGRNLRDVWTISPTGSAYSGDHFATFPEKLPERCILAGTSAHGVCPTCGAPWQRIVQSNRGGGDWNPNNRAGKDKLIEGQKADPPPPGYRPPTTMGWEPTCDHVSPLPPLPAVVMDPFGGSGTTAIVAQRLSRRAVLIDLNPDYIRQQMERNAQQPLGLQE